MYAASQESYNERKATGFVPVATNDRATLQAIQYDLDKKRPQRVTQAARTKKTVCAGDTSSVSPFLENRCGNIETGTFATSKADLTTGRTIEEMSGQATLPDYRRNLNN
jgi:hypothetical protein